MKVMSASELTKALLSENKWPKGSDEDLKFGKIFEEEFSLWRHLYDGMRVGRASRRGFIAKIRRRLKAEGIYSEEKVLKAYRIAATFIKFGVAGETPKTCVYEIDDEHGIFYKPDLHAWDTIWELKTHPLTEFDEIQAGIFALCEGKAIKLVGVEFDEEGMAHVQIKTVEPFKDIKKLKEIIGRQGEEYTLEYELKEETDGSVWVPRNKGGPLTFPLFF